MGAAVLAIGSVAVSTAHAHSDRPYYYYRACVTADYGAWLYASRCDREDYYPDSCWVSVNPGRAFRVERQRGGYLRVRNLETRGWVELNSLRIAPQAYCRAAGL
jgi:hypothetical protein